MTYDIHNLHEQLVRFYWVSLNPPTIDPRTTDQPTHRPTDPKFTDPLTKFCFKDFIIKRIYFAECKHSCGNIKLYFGLFYLTFVFLTNIKSIRRIKICLFFCLLNYVLNSNTLLLPCYFKVTFYLQKFIWARCFRCFKTLCIIKNRFLFSSY